MEPSIENVVSFPSPMIDETLAAHRSSAATRANGAGGAVARVVRVLAAAAAAAAAAQCAALVRQHVHRPRTAALQRFHTL